MNINQMVVNIKKFNENTVWVNKRARYVHKTKKILFSLVKFIILLGISYIILGPIIKIVSNSFFTRSDAYNPSVFLFPLNPSTGNYTLTLARLDYWRNLGLTLIYIVVITLIQVLITSMVGYGFARFQFPFKGLLFGCVILTIVLPTNTIMLPLYQHFRNWDFFGILQAVTGSKANLLSSEVPMVLLTLLGCGLRSGLFIYIFRQFFRGLPKEIEEAAFIDGAGMWYTYLRIMLVNAIPAVITVMVFTLVWAYNDTFYTGLFAMPANRHIPTMLTGLGAQLANYDKIQDPIAQQLAVYSGVVLILLPILILYLLLQRYFMEGVERSGIVG